MTSLRKFIWENTTVGTIKVLSNTRHPFIFGLHHLQPKNPTPTPLLLAIRSAPFPFSSLVRRGRARQLRILRSTLSWLKVGDESYYSIYMFWNLQCIYMLFLSGYSRCETTSAPRMRYSIDVKPLTASTTSIILNAGISNQEASYIYPKLHTYNEKAYIFSTHGALWFAQHALRFTRGFKRYQYARLVWGLWDEMGWKGGFCMVEHWKTGTSKN